MLRASGAQLELVSTSNSTSTVKDRQNVIHKQIDTPSEIKKNTLEVNFQTSMATHFIVKLLTLP